MSGNRQRYYYQHKAEKAERAEIKGLLQDWSSGPKKSKGTKLEWDAVSRMRRGTVMDKTSQMSHKEICYCAIVPSAFTHGDI